MQQTMERGTQVRYPVDNGTYNLITTLSEKLKALETYEKYSKDVDGRELELYKQLIDEDSRHAQQIFDVLRERMGR
jgi:rubrerythrin